MSEKVSKKFFKKRSQKTHQKQKELPSQEHAPEGTVEFHNFNQLKKKTVRGLLRKRAKKYDCNQL